MGPEVVSELLVAAVSGWDKHIDWPGAALSLITASEVLRDDGWLDAESHKAVVAHVQATGMLDCERIINLANVDEARLTLLNLGFSADYERIPAGVQFRHELPQGFDELHVNVLEFTGSDKGTGLAIYVRVGAPVEHETERMEGLGLQHAIPVNFDAVFEVDEESAELVLNAANVPGFYPGQDLYWSVASINRSRVPMDAVYLSVTMAAEAMEVQPAVQKAEQKSGCVQAPVRPTRTNVGSWMWIVLLAALSRRKIKHTI